MGHSLVRVKQGASASEWQAVRTCLTLHHHWSHCGQRGQHWDPCGRHTSHVRRLFSWTCWHLHTLWLSFQTANYTLDFWSSDSVVKERHPLLLWLHEDAIPYSVVFCLCLKVHRVMYLWKQMSGLISFLPQYDWHQGKSSACTFTSCTPSSHTRAASRSSPPRYRYLNHAEDNMVHLAFTSLMISCASEYKMTYSFLCVQAVTVLISDFLLH